jgi:hypothetical protein
MIIDIVNMYESRLRATVRRGTSDVDCQMGVPVTTHQYRNRTNVHVLQRYLDEAEARLPITVQEHALRLEQVIADNEVGPDDDVLDRRLKSRRQAVARTDLIDLQERMSRRWEGITSQLTHTTGVATLAISSKLLGRTTEVFSVDSDRCSTCGRILIFDQSCHLSVCTTCRIVQSVLVVAEDVCNDVMVFKAQTLADPTYPVTAAPGDDIVAESNSDEDKIQQYTGYLAQFAADVAPLPTVVLECVYRNLSTIHILTNVRCRPTPIVHILKQHELVAYIPQAVRISKIFNGEKVPCLDGPLMQRLVSRFRILVAVARTSEVKLPSNDMMSHILLHLEGRSDLAECFPLQKTQSVLALSDDKVRLLIEGSRNIFPDMSWNLSRLV